jgi:hypothetical protein
MLVVRNKVRGDVRYAKLVIIGGRQRVWKRPRSFSATAALIGPLVSHLLYLIFLSYHFSSRSLLLCNISSRVIRPTKTERTVQGYQASSPAAVNHPAFVCVFVSDLCLFLSSLCASFLLSFLPFFLCYFLSLFLNVSKFVSGARPRCPIFMCHLCSVYDSSPLNNVLHS